MEFITSFVDNYKASMAGLHSAAKVLITAATIFVLVGVATAVINIFVAGI